MKYEKSSSIQGKWIRGGDMQSGMQCTLTTETNPMPSQFQNKDGSMKMQDVSKIKFKGTNEELNINLNRATLNALIDAFGSESKNWIGKVLIVETEKMRVGGKAVVAVYLIPDGYERVDDENGYAIIVKKGLPIDELPTVNVEDGGKEELPF